MTKQQGQFSKAQKDEIKSRVRLSSLIGQAVKLTKDGRDFRGCCPFHHENTPSFYVFEDDHYHCFGCGAHGDHFDWLQEQRGMPFTEALEFLAAWTGVTPDSAPMSQPREPQRDEAEWTPIVPVPSDAPDLFDANGGARIYNPKRAGSDKEWTTLRPVMTHTYLDGSGTLLGYVLRCQFADGGKFTPQVTWCRNRAGERRWCLYPFPEPRPLYGLEQLPGRKPGFALLVEGEKCVDVARRILSVPVLSWPGGSNGISKVDFSPLAGWKLMIWPDADAAGQKAAEGCWNEGRDEAVPGAAQMASRAGVLGVRIVEPPAEAPKGWDIADAIESGWDRSRIEAHMRAALREARDPAAPPAAQGAPEPVATTDSAPPVGNVEPPAIDDAPPPPSIPDVDPYDDEPPAEPSDHFRALGYDRSHFFFLTKRGGQVLKFVGTALKDVGVLMQLAPLQYWEREFPGRTGVATNMAANMLIAACYGAGPYNAAMLRGRGAWWDDGRTVIHLGNRLVIDGSNVDLLDFQSRFIYERAKAFRSPSDTPLSAAEARRFLDLCCLLSFERVLSGYLLAGWCVIAPICGALEWRPSIWLIGPSGTGKGWIIKNIINPVVGDWGIFAEGDTSAKGIEHEMQSDARPVIFDEAEAESEREQARIQQVLFLMRVASSSEGGRQYKGTIDGKGRNTQLRTCFSFASVNMHIKQGPDESRIAPLALVPQSDPSEFTRIKEERRQIITPEMPSRLLARSIKLIPVIRRNAETFAEAATELFGSRRVGDQIGTLLAGAFSLNSNREITHEAARAWIEGKDWTEYTVLGSETDERRFLSFLMQTRVRVATSGGNTAYDLTLGELILAGYGKGGNTYLGFDTADTELRRHGIRLHDNGFYVSTTHSALKRHLRDTPWSSAWRVPLSRLPGHVKSEKTIHFGPGAKTPAAWLPLALLED